MRGLFLEGAKWSHDETSLAESDPKVLFSMAPVILFRPTKKADMSTHRLYLCPVYKTRCVSCLSCWDARLLLLLLTFLLGVVVWNTSERRGTLSTTGHSTNFICYIRLPTNKPDTHWVARGVAMLTQLDD